MEKPKSSLIKAITTRDEAMKTVKDVSIAFLVLAAIQGGLGFIIMPSMIIDAVILAVMAGLLWSLKSRIAACILLLMGLIMTISTTLNFLGISQLGGRNIWLAVIMLWCAVKGVEATFKLHGRFKSPEPTGAPDGDSGGSSTTDR